MKLRYICLFLLNCFGLVLHGRSLDSMEGSGNWYFQRFGEASATVSGGVATLTLDTDDRRAARFVSIHKQDEVFTLGASTIHISAEVQRPLASRAITGFAMVNTEESLQRYDALLVGLTESNIFLSTNWPVSIAEINYPKQLEDEWVRLQLSLHYSNGKVSGSFGAELPARAEQTFSFPLATPAKHRFSFFLGEIFPESGRPITASLRDPTISVAVPGNKLALITDFSPQNGSVGLAPLSHNLLEVPSFTLQDEAPLNLMSVPALITGVPGAGTLSLNRTADPQKVFVHVSREFQPNTNITARLVARENLSNSNVLVLRFDTFCEAAQMVELEHYNFDGGQWIETPILQSEDVEPVAGSYFHRQGRPGEDYFSAENLSAENAFRPGDNVRLVRSLDVVRSKFLTAAQLEPKVYDYDAAHWQTGDFLTYTRSFGPGTYDVYLRQALLHPGQIQVCLEAEGSDGSYKPLGYFDNTTRSFDYRNIRITDDNGKVIALQLSGTYKLRLRVAEASTHDNYQNYLVFAPRQYPCFAIHSSLSADGPYQMDYQVGLSTNIVSVPLQHPSQYFIAEGPSLMKFTPLGVTNGNAYFRIQRR